MDTCGDVDRTVKLALASLVSDARSCQPTLSLGFLGKFFFFFLFFTLELKKPNLHCGKISSPS